MKKVTYVLKIVVSEDGWTHSGPSGSAEIKIELPDTGLHPFPDVSTAIDAAYEEYKEAEEAAAVAASQKTTEQEAE